MGFLDDLGLLARHVPGDARNALKGLLGDMPLTKALRGEAEVSANGLKNALMGMPVGDAEGAYEAALNIGPMGLLGKLTKFEKAHQIAQKNAAEMLGLPADNTAAQRAIAMGFNGDVYHGTERLDRVTQDWKKAQKRATSGPMPFFTDDTGLASGYSTSKVDTSRVATDSGGMANYFQVSPKDMGLLGRTPYSVEQTWWRLTPEQKATIQERIPRIGYENFDQADGPLTLHPSGVNASIAGKDHWDYTINREAKGNPLTAIRNVWGEGGDLVDSPEQLADIYKLAGYPFPISQENAPWYKANGVLTGKVRIENPIDAGDAKTLTEKVIPALEDAFKRDRSRTKSYGADQWDKNLRYTPKDWVAQLKADVATGENSHVWTSIPDKVTEQLRRLGFDGILDVSGKNGGTPRKVVIPFEPNQIRSKFAAFDPKRKYDDDLLAAYFGAPLGQDE